MNQCSRWVAVHDTHADCLEFLDQPGICLFPSQTIRRDYCLPVVVLLAEVESLAANDLATLLALSVALVLGLPDIFPLDSPVLSA